MSSSFCEVFWKLMYSCSWHCEFEYLWPQTEPWFEFWSLMVLTSTFLVDLMAGPHCFMQQWQVRVIGYTVWLVIWRILPKVTKFITANIKAKRGRQNLSSHALKQCICCLVNFPQEPQMYHCQFCSEAVSMLAVCWPREQAAHDIKASTRALTFDCISAFEQNWWE